MVGGFYHAWQRPQKKFGKVIELKGMRRLTVEGARDGTRHDPGDARGETSLTNFGIKIVKRHFSSWRERKGQDRSRQEYVRDAIDWASGPMVRLVLPHIVDGLMIRSAPPKIVTGARCYENVSRIASLICTCIFRNKEELVRLSRVVFKPLQDKSGCTVTWNFWQIVVVTLLLYRDYLDLVLVTASCEIFYFVPVFTHIANAATRASVSLWGLLPFNGNCVDRFEIRFDLRQQCDVCTVLVETSRWPSIGFSSSWWVPEYWRVFLELGVGTVSTFSLCTSAP